jgi:hypothetical protein
VKEQSHKDEMSRALRGDFERLRERGVSTTLAPGDSAAPEPGEPPLSSPEPPLEEDRPPPSGWLDRLLGR